MTPAPQRENPDDLIARVAEIESESEQPDLGIDLNQYRKQFEIDELIRVQREANDIHKMRLGYAKRIFVLVVGWLMAVAVAVLWTGFGGVNDRAFYLSDKVLIAFISSTTVNVIGLFVVVAKWMYPSGPGSNGKTSDTRKPDSQD